MRRTITLLALIAATAAPAVALAGNTVDPTLIPDGTYNATVEKVVDGKHMTIKMNNGVETTVSTTRSNVDFSNVHPNDQIKMSLIKGEVAVFIVTH